MVFLRFSYGFPRIMYISVGFLQELLNIASLARPRSAVEKQVGSERRTERRRVFDLLVPFFCGVVYIYI